MDAAAIPGAWKKTLWQALALAPLLLAAYLWPALAVPFSLLLPLVVWGLARLLGLPPMETRVVTLLSSIAIGANVYLMARQFKALEGPVASSQVLTTGLAALTTPLVLTLSGL